MKYNTILSSTLQVTMIVLFIKILGFVKQIVIAAQFGASQSTDAYLISTGVVNSLATVLFSAISVSLLSLYINKVEQMGETVGRHLIDSGLKVFLLLGVLFAVAIAFFAPIVAKLLAPSYDGAELQVLIRYVRCMSTSFILAPYYLTINVVLEAKKRFLPGKGLAFFQNIYIILAALFLSYKFGVDALVYAFVFAGISQCILLTICARRTYCFSPRVSVDWNSIRFLISGAIPVMLGNAVYELNDIVDKRIASSVVEGGVSMLSYGASLNEIVTTLVISSVSTVLFAHFATWAAQGEKNRISESLLATVKVLFALIAPIMVILFLCGKDIVIVMYRRGGLDNVAMNGITWVLWGYTAGLLFQAVRSTVVKVFYALQDTRTPMVNGVISVAVNIMLSIFLSRTMGIGGISLATSIAMLYACAMLFRQIPQMLPTCRLRLCVREGIKIFCSAVVAGSGGFIMSELFPMQEGIIRLLIVGVVVFLIYCFLMVILRSDCLHFVYQAVLRKRKIEVD